MNEQEKTLAAYKEYLLECANNDSLDFTAINKKYEFCSSVKEWTTYSATRLLTLSEADLFRHKKRTVVVNGKTVPAPTMDSVPDYGEYYYTLDMSKLNYIMGYPFNSHANCDSRLIRCGWFDNEQDASEYFKALLGIE